MIHTEKGQRGAALIIALIFTLVATMLGISAMESSEMEIQLVNNDQFREASFRAAESASGKLFTDTNITSLATGSDSTITSTNSVDSSISVHATLTESGTGLARGFSLGESIAGFQVYKFTANATATISGVSSRRQILQGSERLAPSL